MANPMFNMPEVENPQLAAANTMAQMQQPEMMPSGVMGVPGGQAPPQPQQGYMTPRNLSEIYGIMAGGNRPQAAGEGYVRAMQAQQQLDADDSDMEKWLRLYGNVNPYDFTADSLSKFHNTLVETGDIAQAFTKLERVETLSTKEQGFLNESINKYTDAEQATARMMGLADRYEQANAAGIRSGVPARLEDWFLQFAGNEGDFQLLRGDFERLRNSEVIQNLPKGPASDKDIEIAQRGWPRGTANPAYIAAFLRGLAKLKAIEQAQAMHQAHFISRNKTQQGQLADWQKDREYWMLRAIQQTGGIYNPLNADGSEMTADEALMARYGNTNVVGAPPTGQPSPSPVDQAAESAANVTRDVESTLEKYRRLRKQQTHMQ